MEKFQYILNAIQGQGIKGLPAMQLDGDAGLPDADKFKPFTSQIGKIFGIIFGIITAIAVLVCIFFIIKIGISIAKAAANNDAEGKSAGIKNIIWVFLGLMVALIASAVIWSFVGAWGLTPSGN